MPTWFSSIPGNQIDALFREQRVRDPLGVRIHEFCAFAACFFAGWPTVFVEWAGLPVLLACLIRLTGHRRVPGPLLWDASVRLLLAWVACLLVSILWTVGSRREWTGDIQALRFASFVLTLYPVLDRRPTMIAALALGLVCGQLAQGLDILGHVLGVSWLDFQRAAGRHSGWWDPAVGGSILCAALGLHVGALATAWNRPSRTRWLALAGSLSTLVCILLTGTRGAWVASVVIVAGGVLLAAWRSPRRGRVLAVGATGAALVAIAASALIWSGALGIRDRLDRGLRETRAALQGGDYATDTGMRIAMARWALDEFASHPILGVGAGGYRAWADQRLAESTASAAPRQHPLPRPHAHAHNWYLHTLATLGLVGTALLLAMVAVSIASGLRWRGSPATGYAAAPAMALFALATVGMFDSIHINAQTAYLLYVLIALCVACRPTTVDPEGA